MFDKETTDTIVKGALVKALGDDNGQRILGEVVDHLLKAKVNSHGKTTYDSYGGTPNTPLLDYLIQGEARRIIETAVAEQMEQYKPQIEAAVQKALIEDGGAAKGITKLIESMIGNGYLNISVDFKER